MRCEIVATLGPASRAPVVWQAMLDAGAAAFRLNTSHLALDQLHAWIDQLETRRPADTPLVLDLQGSKWRLGQFEPITLAHAQTIQLILGSSSTRSDQLPVPHPDFFRAAALSSGEIVLNDAKIKLQIESLQDAALSARVLIGGEVSARKGLTLPRTAYRREALSEKDQLIVAQTRHRPGVRYAVSYLKDAVELAQYRTLIGAPAYLIAKIERQTAVDDVRAIAALADEVWVCRGDLGAELGLRAMAQAVHAVTAQVRELPVSVLMAGQVLEHMVDHPAPTRAEVCALHDALAAGYRGVVLSDEAAIGRYPIESVRAAALFQT